MPEIRSALTILNKAQKIRSLGIGLPVFVFIAESFEEIQSALNRLEAAIREITSAAASASAGTASAWQSPVYENGWTDLGGGFAPLRYRITSFGSLEMAGVCGNGTAGAVMFTLPVGYRPISSRGFAIGTGAAASTAPFLKIDPPGFVTAVGMINTAAGAYIGGIISLD
jgi:hypothetical protein